MSRTLAWAKAQQITPYISLYGRLWNHKQPTTSAERAHTQINEHINVLCRRIFVEYAMCDKNKLMVNW